MISPQSVGFIITLVQRQLIPNTSEASQTNKVLIVLEISTAVLLAIYENLGIYS